MAVKMKEAERILESYRDKFDQMGLFYSRTYANPERGTEGDYENVIICSGPLRISGSGVDEVIAKRIAEKK